jgi:hypothetical protein
MHVRKRGERESSFETFYNIKQQELNEIAKTKKKTDK